MTARLRQRCALVLAVGSLLVGCVAKEPGEIRVILAAGHTPTFSWVGLLGDFLVPEIDRRLAEEGSPYRIHWTQAYGGSLVRLGGVLEAMEEGLIEMGIVGTVFEAPKMPLQNVSYIAPFGAADGRIVTRAVLELHDEIPAMREAWWNHNLEFLGGAALDNYDLYTTFPVRGLADLAGRKILAPGPAANWLNGTGAIAVAGTLATYYNDLKTGVADGTLTLVTGCYGARLHEVAPYMTRVAIGSQFAIGLAANRDFWRRLPPEVRRVMREVADDYTARLAEEIERRAAAELELMKAQGLRVSEFPDDERRRWARAIPNVARTWIATHEARGLPAGRVLDSFLAHLRAAGVALPRDWSAE